MIRCANDEPCRATHLSVCSRVTPLMFTLSTDWNASQTPLIGYTNDGISQAIARWREPGLISFRPNCPFFSPAWLGIGVEMLAAFFFLTANHTATQANSTCSLPHLSGRQFSNCSFQVLKKLACTQKGSYWNANKAQRFGCSFFALHVDSFFICRLRSDL